MKLPINPMSAKPSVSLVIPMFNEELNIAHAVSAAVEALERYADDYEILIVDDASTDGSARIVNEAAALNPRIRMIRHAVNRKLGGSLKTGYSAASKDLVLYMDADLPFDPDVLGRAIRALDVTGADMIAGYRLDRTIEGFRRLAVEASRTRVLAFLHVSSVGRAPWPAGEATDLDLLDVPAAIGVAPPREGDLTASTEEPPPPVARPPARVP